MEQAACGAIETYLQLYDRAKKSESKAQETNSTGGEELTPEEKKKQKQRQRKVSCIAFPVHATSQVEQAW